ncbi:MAG TPA: ribonuclease HII [Methanoregula sp.]|nr:ribonuclease HII [Methanoregula sp.]
MICGVDEAGKGSVLGPMVVAAVGVSSEDVFSDFEVNDSKLLSSKVRERLYAIIRKRFRVVTVRIEAHEIDEIRMGMTMNACVARAHARVIDKLSPTLAYVDACDVNAIRYADTVKSHLEQACEIVSEHHADQTFKVVSAASIVAKVTRDRAIAALSKKYGEIGSGYPSDPVTIRFLNSYIDEHRVPPPIARKSWKTVSAILTKKTQSSLRDF